MDRKKLALKTSAMGLFSKVILILLNFCVRFVFIRYLGQEILGLEGVIKDTVSLLAMADIGIDVAMTFRLYKIVNEKDEKKIVEYLYVYKIIYRIILCLIFFLGLIGTFFLKNIITRISIEWNYIYIAYLLQVLSICASYICAYKRCLLNAYQNKYIQLKVETIIGIFITILKIIVIIYFKNYFYYLVLSILQNIISNILLAYYCDKKYLKDSILEKKVKILQSKIVKDIYDDSKNILGNKIVGFIYSSTDNIVISRFLGTDIVAYLSNYKMIFLALNNLLIGAISSITPIIGNYLNSNVELNQTFVKLRQLTQIRFCFATLCVVPSYLLGNQFIEIYAGTKWILNEKILLLLCLDFYIGCIYGGTSDFSIGVGIFNKQKKVSIIGAAFNIVFSLILVRILGIEGVLLGTVISQLILWFGNWLIIYNHAKYSVNDFKNYAIDNLKFLLFIFAICFFCKYLIKLINLNNLFFEFLIKLILIELIITIVLLIYFEAKYSLITKFIERLKRI